VIWGACGSPQGMGRALVTRSADPFPTTGWPGGKMGIVGPFQMSRYSFHLALFHTTLFIFIFIFFIFAPINISSHFHKCDCLSCCSKMATSALQPMNLFPPEMSRPEFG